jgi:hypothetical protein
VNSTTIYTYSESSNVWNYTTSELQESREIDGFRSM